MRIAVMGAGGIGAFAGARLSIGGADVRLIARGRHLGAIVSDGLTVLSGLGDVTLRLPASEDPAAVGPVDLVLVTVKGRDTPAAVDAIAPLMDSGARALTFQNGLDGVERLAARYGAERVIAGVTYVPAEIERPGVVRHVGAVRRFVFGEWAGAPSERMRRLSEIGTAGGLDMAPVPDAPAALWSKWVMLAPFAALACLTRLNLGAWIAVPETRALYARAMAEMAALAEASGVALPADVVATNLRFAVETADPATRGSMLSDLERGKPLEIDALIGDAVRRGARLGVDMPVLALAAAVLSPHALGRTPQVA